MNRKSGLAAALCLLCTILCANEFILYKNRLPQAEILVEKLPGSLLEKEKKQIAACVSYFNAQVRKCKLPPMKIAQKRTGNKSTILIRIVEQAIHRQDEYVIDFPDRNSMRITASYFSIKYALDELLERCFGVRFLLHSPHWLKPPKGYDRSIEYVYPARKDASIARKKLSRKASFNMKRSFTGDIPKEWNIRSSFSTGHGMVLYPFPARKYAPDNSWPKEILPVIRGKKVTLPKYKKLDPKKKYSVHHIHVAQYIPYMGYWNPCFSNPRTAEIAASNIIEIMEKEPINPLYNNRRYNVCMGINDCGGHCECAECLAAIKGKKGSFGPNYSELYWKWVNDVAKIVTKKYPKLYFNCLAYREVTDPPSFKLHPNVIPMICRELNAGSCPVQKKKIEELFKSWKEKASVVFLWDYVYGATYYVFPRIFFNLHAEMLRIAYRNNVRGLYCEGADRINMSGPSHHIIAKTMWDVNTDVNAVLKQWCIDAVGPKAAPELERYYKFWDAYWMREDVRKTNHFNSARNIYMSLGDSGSYTYAIRKGEMAYLRKLLENVLKKAQTKDQKARAQHFLNVFAISEDAAKCLYSEYLEPDGFVKDAANAVALLRSVPEACKALERQKKNPLVIAPQYNQRILQVFTGGVGNLRGIEKFVKHPAVRKELSRLAENKAIPAGIRTQAKIMLGVPMKNFMKNGSFEGPAPRKETDTRIYRGKINPALATHGKRSFGKVNPLVREVLQEGIVYGKTYMVLVDVYAAKNSAEGVAHLLTNPQAAGKNTKYILLSNLKLNKGWQTLSNTITITGKREEKKANRILFQVWGSKFEKDEPIYFDNIRIYQLD